MATLVEAGWEPRATADETDPLGVALAAALRVRVAAQLDALPDRYRVPVVLRHVDDLSYAELAEVLGRPEGTLKSQVSRGLAMLRASLTAHELEELTA
jgi:RNA polymerase sigma factor (sigma-70 family)